MLFGAVAIRDMDEGDLHFVLSSWIQSYRPQAMRREPPAYSASYFASQRERCQRLLAESKVTVASDAQDPHLVYAWVCHSPDNSVVHFSYTKREFRGLGLEADILAYIHLDTRPVPVTAYINREDFETKWVLWGRKETS